MTTIANMPTEDRPREKLESNGASCLTDSELLAIVLCTSGKKGVSVLDLAKNIIKQAGSLRSLAQMGLEELRQIEGVGFSKAMQVKAVFELAIRHERELTEKKPIFASPKELANYFMPKFRNHKKEVFTVLLFDSQHRLIKEETIAIGTLAKVLVEPREVFFKAISMQASSVIMIHNHPSGIITPSDDDIELTKQIAEAGKILGVPVLDHLILGENDFYSFRENEMME